MAEVLVGTVGVRAVVTSAGPAVGSAASARSVLALTGPTPAETRQRLGDRLGGVVRFGVAGTGGHTSILHAT